MQDKIIYSGHIYEESSQEIPEKLINMYEDDDDGTYINTINAAESNHGTFVVTATDPVVNAIQILKDAKATPYNNSEYQGLAGLWYISKDKFGKGTIYNLSRGWTTEELETIKAQVG